MTNQQMIQDFKGYIIDSVDVYDIVKSYLNTMDIDDNWQYREALDYMMENLSGGLQWVDEDSSQESAS